ncbi:hypothetical protein PHMEG_00031766 [Phytophthora megakarya]|uniref:SET domain-containing protein n=1 Tax=Phytophthora megakarya TaxID=4795 RepID=A0A225UXB8_9STRA|nr:hypothetical protein PHMEG_00031766 [Phytophthora megakarya]
MVAAQRPERPTHPIRVAINSRHRGSYALCNHRCAPVAQLLEVANGRSRTVVVATIEDVREGDENAVDYGSELWFVCRCEFEDCRHRAILDQRDLEARRIDGDQRRREEATAREARYQAEKAEA